MARDVFTGYACSVGADTGATADDHVAPARRAYYGIAEIADALGMNRQLITAWRRRGSHGMPKPDAELSAGPVWRGDTIEPWIDSVRSNHGDQTGHPLCPSVALRAGRRMLRLAAVLLEEPIRTRLLNQVLADARELLPIVDAAADDPLSRAVADLVLPVRETANGPTDLTAFRAQVLGGVEHLSALVELVAARAPASTIGVGPEQDD
jgi:hypothetical protein